MHCRFLALIWFLKTLHRNIIYLGTEIFGARLHLALRVNASLASPLTNIYWINEEPTCEADICISIFQMRKWELREVKQLAQVTGEELEFIHGLSFSTAWSFIHYIQPPFFLPASEHCILGWALRRVSWRAKSRDRGGHWWEERRVSSGIGEGITHVEDIRMEIRDQHIAGETNPLPLSLTVNCPPITLLTEMDSQGSQHN